MNTANKYFIDGNHPEAIETLLELIRKKPNYHLAYVILSQIHDEIGDHDRSLSYLLIAAQVAEKDSLLWANVATKSKEAGNTRQVIIFPYK